MTEDNIGARLQDQVRQEAQEKRGLNIVSGGSKTMLGRRPAGDVLAVSGHRGIVDYDPRELVLSARAGTPLAEIEQTLADNNQMLAFEPPHFGDHATLGGTIACGLSGPRRPYAGAARDFVLGCRLLNGKAEILRFGGQVMKNVAGYDISRLMAGAWGTLGVLLEVSLKVLPRPAAVTTLYHECSAADAITLMSGLLGKALPVDAACYYKGQCYLRLAGSERSVHEARRKLPGDALSPRSHFWQRLGEQQLSFFNGDKPLWRIVVKPDTPPLALGGEWLFDWGGAQRWLFSDNDAQQIRGVVQQHGGHATMFRGGDRDGEVFQPLAEPLRLLHQRLKTSFDPQGIFNPGRMYAEL